MQWAKWVLKQTESEWRQVKLVERVIYNLNKQAVSCAFCFNCGSSLWKRTERSRKTSLLEPVNVLHFWWQLIYLKQTIDYCKINLQLNDKSFPLEFSHLSLWRDGLDVCHVAGDRQDVELVINDNTVFAGCKWQNESENSETKSIKVSNLKKKKMLQIKWKPEEFLPLVEPSHHILMSLGPVPSMHVLNENKPQWANSVWHVRRLEKRLHTYHDHSVQLLEGVHCPQQ